MHVVFFDIIVAMVWLQEAMKQISYIACMLVNYPFTDHLALMFMTVN